METCSVCGCDEFVYLGNLCKKHQVGLERANRGYEKREMKSPYNYIRVNGKTFLEHRVIMENNLGRVLAKEEVVHHINGNGHDNRIKNLILVESESEHTRIYHNDVNGEGPPPEPIMEQIRARVSEPSMTFDKCFCGEPVHARNLCSSHYGTAKTFHLFTPHKNRGTWIRMSPETFSKIKNRLRERSSAHETCFCGKPVRARNLCNTHYFAATRHNLHKEISHELHTRPNG